jgi:hypothetical protein
MRGEQGGHLPIAFTATPRVNFRGEARVSGTCRFIFRSLSRRSARA